MLQILLTYAASQLIAHAQQPGGCAYGEAQHLSFTCADAAPGLVFSSLLHTCCLGRKVHLQYQACLRQDVARQ